MQTCEQRFQYEKLELIAPKPSLPNRFRALLKTVGEFVLNLSTVDQDPKIVATRDRAGNPKWSVYDPQSGYANTFTSEDEVRFWLETRHR
ncbi:MAG: hypothetical protein ACFB5Z_14945 [Elainellaceae cyanobacterium]